MPKKLPELESLIHSEALAYGKWGKKFEEALREYISIPTLLTTNTYASAIQVALTILGLKPGDEVIASPMCCLASSLPLVTFGLKVIWADIDPCTGTLHPDAVKKKITSDTKLIFHNHYCGYIGYVEEINVLGKERGIPVIDDCIEAFGSKYKGNIAGNLGTDISIFSFQTIRLPNTIDGGAIAFNDERLFKKALLVRDFGIDRAFFRDENNEIFPLCDIPMPGYGAVMSNVNSYIGYMQLRDIPSLLLKQKKNALEWDKKFDAIQGIYRLNKRDDVEPNYWVYGFLVSEKMKFLMNLRKEGFYASGVHLNNNNYSVFGKKENLLGVEKFNSAFLAVPSGWWVNGIC
jgi:dTDP-4-amino-4,6-dideoxygalactose transaminase